MIDDKSLTVETLTITGQWVPKDGVHILHNLASASLETFAARLEGKASRIVSWPHGDIVVTVPAITAEQTRNLVRGI